MTTHCEFMGYLKGLNVTYGDFTLLECLSGFQLNVKSNQAITYGFGFTTV